MILEIVTPEATLLQSEVELVSVPGINGEFQMLNNHAPIVSLLVEGSVVFKGDNVKIEEEFESKFTSNKNEYTLPIKSGTIEMKENKVIILAD
ncbi:F-type H+-transporting ATPase subunit epsilon [Lutibacter agarilyticus]|uniref:F-type H+-transporting ATPase subunit epsilon n=1 Tax=Lutibacter agarilyticus TaxID=1109740 RepID=A0A238VVR7_9FLAO|nr:F0F1 ATP synthase subunit epsilon [Lutibacter agarilyticus]SNR38224.1 F-type H+-transporting ATPase subunit epsilon [Lutibacter agarilyticus]